MAHVVPGLEDVTWEELRQRDPDARPIATWSDVDRRAGVLIFRSRQLVESLLNLRMTEDVFAVAGMTKSLPAGRRALHEVSKLARGGALVNDALALHREIGGAHRRGRPTYRVVVRKAGRHAFRRVDAQRACEMGISRRFPRWRLVEDGAVLEFWLQIVGEEAVLALRLSSSAMRQRNYRTDSLPASLKPTVAHAMVRLAKPPAGGLLVDPACGSGTVLAEAAEAGMRVLGGDIDRSAVRAARRNVRAAGGSAPIARWDATRLPLSSGAVAGLACNLPWGRRQPVDDLSSFYRRFLVEAQRVVRDGGRIVLLTSQRQVLADLVRQRRKLRVERRLQVTVRGTDAWLFVLRNGVVE